MTQTAVFGILLAGIGLITFGVAVEIDTLIAAVGLCINAAALGALVVTATREVAA